MSQPRFSILRFLQGLFDANHQTLALPFVDAPLILRKSPQDRDKQKTSSSGAETKISQLNLQSRPENQAYSVSEDRRYTNLAFIPPRFQIISTTKHLKSRPAFGCLPQRSAKDSTKSSWDPHSWADLPIRMDEPSWTSDPVESCQSPNQANTRPESHEELPATCVDSFHAEFLQSIKPSSWP